MIYKLEKPDLSKIDSLKTLETLFNNKEDISIYLNKTFSPYIYWDEIKYKKIPNYISSEEFWFLVKFIRGSVFGTNRKDSIVKSEDGKYFSWIDLPYAEEFLHQMDLSAGGTLLGFDKDFTENDKYQFISRGIMEEAIASSQLEGANTTRKVAKQFLQEGRKPKNKSEHMILNGYLTMQAIEENYKNKKLDKDILFELHAMITKNTILKDEVGRYRTDEEDIVVANQEDIIYYKPPNMKFVEEETERLIAFANDDLGEVFIHPIIKAVMIHFWIGYLHPFIDGNGRLARLLFYWYLLRKNYWAFAYLPISLMIKKSPIQYAMAYVCSEQDDLDLTYFVDYNLRKIGLAMKNFEEYVRNQAKINREMNKQSKTKYDLNDRQIRLLQRYHKNKDESTTLKVHKNINKISKMTAIKDLKKLVELGFLAYKKQGRNIYYYATDKVVEIFK